MCHDTLQMVPVDSNELVLTTSRLLPNRRMNPLAIIQTPAQWPGFTVPYQPCRG